MHFVYKIVYNMPLNAIEDDTGMFLCCHDQEREDRKLQCVDQKPVTASLAFRQTLTMASLFSCRHQTSRVPVSLSENTPVSVWVTWNVSQASEWNSLGAGDLRDPWAGSTPYGQQWWCNDGRFLKVESVAGSGPLPGENPCCPYYSVGIIFKERAKGGRYGSSGQWEVDGHLYYWLLLIWPYMKALHSPFESWLCIL